MFRFLMPALALLVAPVAHAQEARDADPALWVVKDADTTIYLFGTVHVLKPGLSWFDEAVKSAFDKSDELVLEMVQPDPAEMQAILLKTGIDMNARPLTERLPADKREAYGKVMADVGLPPAMFEKFDPWLVSTMMVMTALPKLGYDPASGAEGTLTAAAKAANKPVIGLETAAQQLGYFDGLPDPIQIKYLVSAIDDFPKLGETMDKMVASWSAGDPEALARTLNEEMQETPEIAKVLLTERNARWAEWIEQRMAKPGTVFLAVGAGHLAGGDSVQAQLAKKKLTATRVAY